MMEPRDDGRNIDRDLGVLEGEGSHQQTSGGEQRALAVYAHQPSSIDRDDPTYYDHPVIKRSVWSIDIPAYYYIGGLSGACAVIGAAAQLAGKDRFPALTRQGRWISTIGGALSTYFLIHDLGRPARFLYMLRVFRPTSPMNVGAWILGAFAPITTASAIIPHGPTSLVPLGDLLALAAGPLGTLLAGYTGVLVSNTTVPIWNAGRTVLPVLFISSAASSSAAAFEFLDLNRHEQRAIKSFGVAGALAEIACMTIYEREAGRVPQVALPLKKGLSGFLWKTAKVLTIVSLGLFLWPSRSKRARRIRGVVGTAAGLSVRFAVHYAGDASAADPRATFHQQRALNSGNGQQRAK
jgi:formate-dependent nitrite reductase membrane component NrfD